MELLELIETIRQGDADVNRIFAGDGVSVRSGVPKGQAYQKKLLETAQFIADVKAGRRSPWQLQEAMSTSDFPLLFGDIFDRQMLAAYREWPNQWDRIAKKVTARDFRTMQLLPPLIGGTGRMDEVGQLEEYPEAAVSEQARIEYKVKKFGRRFSISWETIIGDLMGQFDDLPQRLARAARRTEDRAVTELFVDLNGPHASFYTVGDKNIINTTNGAATNNPALSIAGLQDAMTVITNQRDEDGEPIFLDMVTLVVPPALEVTALNILNALQMEIVEAGGTANQKLIAVNWMKQKVTLVVMPYIPMIATTANGDRSWFLFANPNVNREGIRVAHLTGHEEPEIWIKEPNARRIGGGAVAPIDGDFDTDAIAYRARHVFGTTRVDPKATVASNGSGA